jgi:hypothetical protein
MLLREIMSGKDRGAKHPATPRAPAPSSKVCIRCEEHKPIDDFHRHKQMRDGYLNKCKDCCRAWTNEYRKKRFGSLKAAGAASYLRQLETGSRKRVAPQKHGRDRLARVAISARYDRKRAERTKIKSELDEFVFGEALRLRNARAKSTGIKWSVDHIIPLHHKEICGLHVAANMQVVPLRWNLRKHNKSMEQYWPTKVFHRVGL